MESKLDIIMELLNCAGNDITRKIRNQKIVKFSYEISDYSGYRVISVYFEKGKDKNLIIKQSMELDSLNEYILMNETAKQLMRYIVYAKDFSSIDDIEPWQKINVYSSKTIFE